MGLLNLILIKFKALSIDNENDDLFTNDLDKLEINSDKCDQFLRIVNDLNNETSKYEFIKRLK
jgi:hypothetical protein